MEEEKLNNKVRININLNKKEKRVFYYYTLSVPGGWGLGTLVPSLDGLYRKLREHINEFNIKKEGIEVIIESKEEKAFPIQAELTSNKDLNYIKKEFLNDFKKVYIKYK